MKRGIAFGSMLLLIALLLAGCGGKSNPEPVVVETPPATQAVSDEMAAEIAVVEAAIDNIGSVTMESEAKIELAEELYNKLSIEAKEQVGNAKTLTSARDAFDEMQKDIDAVINLIGAIGDVELIKGSMIKLARSNYSKLSSFEQEYVNNYDVLVAAEEAYTVLARQDAYDAFIAEFESEKATDALESAEEFLNSEYGPDFADEVNELCCGAYVKIAKYNYSNGYYQTALYYIDQCKELYADTETVSQIYAVEKSVWQTLADIEPENGEIIEDTLGSGYHSFVVDSTKTSKNTLVKLFSIADESKYKCFYVCAGKEAEISIPDGEYKVKFAEGETWYGLKSLFGQNTVCSVSKDTTILEAEYSEEGVYYWTWTIVRKVKNPDDPFEVTEIDPEDF